MKIYDNGVLDGVQYTYGKIIVGSNVLIYLMTMHV